jgi:septum site-determining protein MinD
MTDGADAAQAYEDIVGRFLGEDIEHRFLNSEKKSFLKKLFGK